MQPRVKVPNGVVLSTSWLLLSRGLKGRVLQRVGKCRKGFGRTAGAGGCVSEPCSTALSSDRPAAGWGQELDEMLTQAGQEQCEPRAA